MGIQAFGLDLHSGFNVLRESILSAVGQPVDLVVSHPPYGGMILYSGNVWGSPHADDLSRCIDDQDFHEKLHIALLNQREATKGGGYYGTIIGDWRRNGRYTSYQAECIARMPSDELAAVLIKQQHNTVSDARAYARMKMPRILHRYILLWQKPAVIASFLSNLSVMARQQSARLASTWKALVRTVLMALGGTADLASIYAKVSENAPERLAGTIRTGRPRSGRCSTSTPTSSLPANGASGHWQRDDRPNLAGRKKRVCFVHSLGPCCLGMFESNIRTQKSGIFNPWGA